MNNELIPTGVAEVVFTHFRHEFAFTFAGWRHGRTPTWRNGAWEA
jgi:hypothetical protein